MDFTDVRTLTGGAGDSGAPPYALDFTTSTVLDLWHFDSAPPPMAPSSGAGTMGPDLLDGRDGVDTLIGEPGDETFDPYAAQVFRLYQATLDRAPDINGLMAWADKLASGARGLREVAEGFTGSAEFRQAYGAADNADFVTLLYDNVLDRVPDAAGLAAWTGRLDRGEMTRAEVVVGFSESAEFRAVTEASAMAFGKAGLRAAFGDDVYRLYRATLDRDPDLTGFQNWSGRLADGMPFLDAVAGFTGSAEFRQAYGATDNAAFVTLLYDNVLDRAPDTAGLAAWTGRLDRGEMTRAQVVQGFAQSREFIGGTEPDLRDWILSLGTDDILYGGGGKNLLMGGSLSDTFVFRAEDNGRHVIVDPEPWDRLHFVGFDYDSSVDLRDHLRNEDTDTVFFDQGVEIRFLGAGVSDVLSLALDF